MLGCSALQRFYNENSIAESVRCFRPGEQAPGASKLRTTTPAHRCWGSPKRDASWFCSFCPSCSCLLLSSTRRWLRYASGLRSAYSCSANNITQRRSRELRLGRIQIARTKFARATWLLRRGFIRLIRFIKAPVGEIYHSGTSRPTEKCLETDVPVSVITMCDRIREEGPRHYQKRKVLIEILEASGFNVMKTEVLTENACADLNEVSQKS